MKRISKTTHHRRAAGFTLVELAAVLAVGAILVVAAIPNLATYANNNRIVATSNDVVAMISQARSEAMKRNEMVIICNSLNIKNKLDTPTDITCVNDQDWETGLLIYSQERVDGEFELPNREHFDKDADYMEIVGLREPRSAGGVYMRSSENLRFGLGFAPDGSAIVFENDGGEHVNRDSLIGDSLVIAVCDDRDEEAGRIVQISHTGRTRIMKASDPLAGADCEA